MERHVVKSLQNQLRITNGYINWKVKVENWKCFGKTWSGDVQLGYEVWEMGEHSANIKWHTRFKKSKKDSRNWIFVCAVCYQCLSVSSVSSVCKIFLYATACH